MLPERVTDAGVIDDRPHGRIVETSWDATNVAWGVASLTRNTIIGNYVGAAFDIAGIGYDSFATAVPVLPGGAAAR